ncbi:DUF389 domain-containing protein [Sphingomonas cannabina]|uniref:DUF389 domain-containing protein n=1 Tax=Sphingomonas cannabina TaxID=2899123 RepID=UPI001F2D04B4|nr:DUF389 domain-containing protein [Sphingomonas cannabina]UIJ45640.1 DUF389 domain-containing protein [Sphingomonas cannabina]
MDRPSPVAVFARWWRANVIAEVEHREVLESIHEDAGWNGRYVFMILMSAGIAMLGLLLSSPAVVIGAMLISPLMGPIIGLGFALATLDLHYIRRSAGALAAGAVCAVLFCALIVLLSPLQNVTSEIAARTRPNLFDLLVALFSALAGAYATIRSRAGTIVGVAIATALMPPLATVGFGLATANGTVFFGALLLFITNFVTIALSGAVMARIYGFGPRLTPEQTLWQSAFIVATFVALAVPLGLTLRQIAWEGLAGRQARAAVASAFPDKARISQVDVDFSAQPLAVRASVLTPSYRDDAESAAAAEFARLVGRPAAMTIDQYRVGVGQAEAAAIQQAGATAPAAADPLANRLAEGLALAAGVNRGQVLIDSGKRQAFVRADPLPGAGLAAYHALEVRLAQGADGWSVHLVPPPATPGIVPFDGDVPSAIGRAAIGDAAWAAARRGEAMRVSGPAEEVETVARALAEAGVEAIRDPGGEAPVRLAWAVPVSEPAPPR